MQTFADFLPKFTKVLQKCTKNMWIKLLFGSKTGQNRCFNLFIFRKVEKKRENKACPNCTFFLQGQKEMGGQMLTESLQPADGGSFENRNFGDPDSPPPRHVEWGCCVS